MEAPFFCEFLPFKRGLIRFVFRNPIIGKESGAFSHRDIAPYNVISAAPVFPKQNYPARKFTTDEEIKFDFLRYLDKGRATWIMLEGDFNFPIVAKLTDANLLSLFEPKLKDLQQC